MGFVFKHIVSKGFITSDASHTEEEVAQEVAAAVVSPTTEWRISKQFIAIFRGAKKWPNLVPNPNFL